MDTAVESSTSTNEPVPNKPNSSSKMSPIPEDKLKGTNKGAVGRVGQYAGPYRLLETLGKGGLATVKVGVDFATGTRVAVKIVDKEKLANPREQVSMAREITIMKVLKHKNVLRLHDIYENEEKIFLILDIYEGGDVYGHLTQHGSMRPSEALHLFRQMIAGVEYCHHNMIVHRDLKPENLLLSRDKKHLVISDFGLSTGMAGSRNFLKTRCGTVHYISPEVARGDPYIGMASDVWSAGIILYAMVTATLPFDGESSVAVLKKIVKGEYNMPSYLPLDLQDLIRKMLALDPEERISITVIKKHPWYRFGLESEPEVPVTPLVSARFTLSDLEGHSEVLDNMKLLGWEEGELQNELLSENMNLAKVFYSYLIKHKPKRTTSSGQLTDFANSAQTSATTTTTTSATTTNTTVTTTVFSVAIKSSNAGLATSAPSSTQTVNAVSTTPQNRPTISAIPVRARVTSTPKDSDDDEEGDEIGYPTPLSPKPSINNNSGIFSPYGNQQSGQSQITPRSMKSSAPGLTRRRSASIDQSPGEAATVSESRPNIVIRRPSAASGGSNSTTKKSREKRQILRRPDTPSNMVRGRASTIDTPTRSGGTPADGVQSPSAVGGTWLLSPSADPRAKMYSVESRKDIGQILDSLKNCFGDMQLEVVEKRSKGGMKVKARLSQGRKSGGSKDIIKVNIRESDDGSGSSLVEIKKPGKSKKEDFHEVAKKLEETLVV